MGAVSNAFNDLGSAVNNVVKGAENTVNAIIKNPLPIIETVALIAVGVPAPVASAAVSAMNGGKIEDIATAAIVAYAAPEIGKAITGEAATVFSSATEPTAGAYLPSAGQSALVKAASSAVGADAAATTIALASGKNLEAALNAGTKAAGVSLATSAGSAAGGAAGEAAGSGTAGKIASTAVSAGTKAGLLGKDALAAATGAGERTATGAALDAAGNVISDVAGSLGAGAGRVLSSAKEAIQPYSDAATAALQPYSDVASAALQPAEKAITGAIKSGSDVATAALQPAEKAITGFAKDVGSAVSDAGSKISDTTGIAGQDITKAGKDALSNRAILDLMGTAPRTSSSGGPAVSDVATGGAGSAGAFGGADVAMLGDTSAEGLGSKVSKKGGKYPFGEPEGTSALKEGLGV